MLVGSFNGYTACSNLYSMKIDVSYLQSVKIKEWGKVR
jgi:hypothetical protein